MKITYYLVVCSSNKCKMSLLNILAIAITVLPLVLSSQDLKDETVTVDIAEGTLKGRSLSTEAGVSYYSFQRIRYAAPPLGELRFKAPQPPLSWEGVRDATTEGGECPQVSLYSPSTIAGDEDCLFLNVYTTQLPSDDVLPNLSVMVWIHGGGFVIGSGGTYSFGPDYLINNKDIVIVTVNYRLGVLGFLGLNHPEVSKNNGLKDQVAALQWVQNNIAKFGGNPNDVTIFGESAGAASVHFLVLSPTTTGLFHKAIAQSGSALSEWGYTDPVTLHERSVALGEVLSYNTSDISELHALLLDADPEDLVRAGNSIPVPLSVLKVQGILLAFGPTHEDSVDAFLAEPPVDVIKSGGYNKVPYITGVNAAEGKDFSVEVHQNSSLWPYYEENFEAIFVPAELGLELGSPESVQVANDLRRTYFGGQSLSEDTMAEFADLESDFVIISSTYRTIKLQIITGSYPMYFYTYSYLGNLSMSNILNYNYSFGGAAHGDELGYLFKMYDYNVTAKENSVDSQAIQNITALWTNFAKTGTPSLGNDEFWYPFNKESHTYINIDKEITIEDYNDFKPEKMDLWVDLFKDIDAI